DWLEWYVWYPNHPAKAASARATTTPIANASRGAVDLAVAVSAALSSGSAGPSSSRDSAGAVNALEFSSPPGVPAFAAMSSPSERCLRGRIGCTGGRPDRRMSPWLGRTQRRLSESGAGSAEVAAALAALLQVRVASGLGRTAGHPARSTSRSDHPSN